MQKTAYPDLSEVISEFDLTIDKASDVIGKASDQVFTFETHPFYSGLQDYSSVEMNEGL